MTKRNEALLGALRRGRERAQSLKVGLEPGDLGVDGSMLAPELKRELEIARELFTEPLLLREQARVRLRAVVSQASGVLKAEALEALAELRAIEESHFSPLRARLREGTYTPEEFRKDLEARAWMEQELFTDRLLGIHDPPPESKQSDLEQSPYCASHLPDIWPLFDELGPQSVFYDLGSGLGKVVFLVRWLTGAEAHGVEYDPALASAADAAHAALGLDVGLQLADAREVDYSRGTFFYLYEPFRGAVLEAVMDKLKAVAATRRIVLVSRWVTAHRFTPPEWLREFKRHNRLFFFEAGPLG